MPSKAASGMALFELLLYLGLSAALMLTCLGLGKGYLHHTTRESAQQYYLHLLHHTRHHAILTQSDQVLEVDPLTNQVLSDGLPSPAPSFPVHINYRGKLGFKASGRAKYAGTLSILSQPPRQLSVGVGMGRIRAR